MIRIRYKYQAAANDEPMNTNDPVDVFVAGGSIAGASVALLAAKAGLSCFVAEAKQSIAEYKALCTHFVQPVASPVLTALGLNRHLNTLDAVRTKAAFRTSSGWIDPDDDYAIEPGGDRLWAYNIERRLLDPFLRQQLEISPTVKLAMNTRVIGVDRTTDSLWQLTLETAGARYGILARALVVADGRQSPVGELLGNGLVQIGENHRSCLFGTFSGVVPPPRDRSLFLLDDSAMAFLYPLVGNRALLSAYVPQEQFITWPRNEREMLLRGMFDPDELIPDLGNAQLEGRLMGFRNYPNYVRAADHAGAFFVGDAAISLDPMSGVGCGYALVSAALAVELIAEHLGSRFATVHAEVATRYRQQLDAVILPHANGIMADSRIARSPQATAAVYRRIVASPELQRAFIALTGRIVSPSVLQKTFLSTLRKPRAA